MSKRCPRCQQENRDHARFCINCNYAFSDQQAAARLCPAGRHVMDPGWSACPYCSGSQSPGVDNQVPDYRPQAGGRTPTVPEGAERQGQPVADEQNQMPARPPAPSPLRQGGPQRRKTEFGDGAIRRDELPTVQNLRSPAPLRRIAAILVSYSWRPDGEVHPVREGRNYIGSDSDCEICVKADPQMSAKHATIIYRGKGTQFVIDDEKSMNGTFLDDKSVDMKHSLRNYAKIKTGATIWTFIMLDPEEATGE